jgi:methionine biosynthesis protein MetW
MFKEMPSKIPERVKTIVQLVDKHLIKNHVSIERILDMGCGRGELAKILSSQLEAKEVVGVDIDEEALKMVTKLRNIMVIRADLNRSLPFKDNYFDLILMAEVIEHVYDTDHVLSESRRVLRPSGYMIVTTPNLAWWLNRLVLLMGYQPYLTNVSTKYDVGKLFRHPLKTGCTGQHIRMFTLKAIKQLLIIYGFRIVEIRSSTLKLLPSPLQKLDKAIAKLNPSLGADLVLLVQKI